MAVTHQTQGRVPLNPRSHIRAGRAAALAGHLRFPGIWHTGFGVTLNGADVSALAAVPWPRKWPAAGQPYNLAQGVAGRQPLFTGAPTSPSGWQSIQFTAANGDNLFVANANAWYGGKGTLLITFALTTPVNGSFVICNTDGATGGIDMKQAGAATPTARQFDLIPGHAHATGTTYVDGAWEVATFAIDHMGIRCLVNGVLTTVSNPTDLTIIDAGAVASIILGAVTSAGVAASNLLFLAACLGPFRLPDNWLRRLSKVMGAQAGIAA